jgi:hypothetical protein
VPRRVRRDRLAHRRVPLDLRARRSRGQEREPHHHQVAEPSESESQVLVAEQGQVGEAEVCSARQ